MRPLFDKAFRDNNGKIVIFQLPNFLFWSWIMIKVISYFLSPGDLKDGFGMLSSAVLFAWAYLEVTKGVNYFRKGLGLVVLAFIVLGYLQVP